MNQNCSMGPPNPNHNHYMDPSNPNQNYYMNPPPRQQTFQPQNVKPYRYRHKMRPPKRHYAVPRNVPQLIQYGTCAYGHPVACQPLPDHNGFQPHYQTPQFQYNNQQPTMHNPNDSSGYQYNAPQYGGHGYQAPATNGYTPVQNMPISKYVYTSNGPVPTPNYYTVDAFGNLKLAWPEWAGNDFYQRDQREPANATNGGNIEYQVPNNHQNHNDDSLVSPIRHQEQEEMTGTMLESLSEEVPEDIIVCEVVGSDMENLGDWSAEIEHPQPEETAFERPEPKLEAESKPEQEQESKMEPELTSKSESKPEPNLEVKPEDPAPEEPNSSEIGTATETVPKLADNVKDHPAKSEKNNNKKNNKKSVRVLTKAQKKAVRKEKEMFWKELLENKPEVEYHKQEVIDFEELEPKLVSESETKPGPNTSETGIAAESVAEHTNGVKVQPTKVEKNKNNKKSVPSLVLTKAQKKAAQKEEEMFWKEVLETNQKLQFPKAADSEKLEPTEDGVPLETVQGHTYKMEVRPAKVENSNKKNNNKKSVPVLTKAQKKAARQEEEMFWKEALEANKALTERKEELCKNYFSFTEIHRKLYNDIMNGLTPLAAIVSSHFQRQLLKGYLIDLKSDDSSWKAEATTIFKKRLEFHQRNKNDDMEIKYKIILNDLKDVVIQNLHTIEALCEDFENMEEIYFEEVFNPDRPVITINENALAPDDENEKRNINSEILELPEWQYTAVAVKMINYCKRQRTIRNLEDLSKVKWLSDLEKQFNEIYSAKKKDFRSRDSLNSKLLRAEFKGFWKERKLAIDQRVPYDIKSKAEFLVTSLFNALLTVRNDVLILDVQVFKEFWIRNDVPLTELVYDYVGMIFDVDWTAL